MKEAAKRLDFERAAELRDRIKALRKVDLGRARLEPLASTGVAPA